MLKSRLKKSAPECPFECGGGCKCYLGNAHMEVLTSWKGLPLNIWTFLQLNFWAFLQLNIWTFLRLDIWTFLRLNIWTFLQLNFWTFLQLNIWTFLRWNRLFGSLCSMCSLTQQEIPIGNRSLRWSNTEAHLLIAFSRCAPCAASHTTISSTLKILISRRRKCWKSLDYERFLTFGDLGSIFYNIQAFPPLRLNAVKKVEGDEASVTERYMQATMWQLKDNLSFWNDLELISWIADAKARGVEEAGELVQHRLGHVRLQQGCRPAWESSRREMERKQSSFLMLT